MEAHVQSWAETSDCEAACTLDLLGLTVLTLGGGDAVAIPKWLPRPDSPNNTCINLIESDRLDQAQELAPGSACYIARMSSKANPTSRQNATGLTGYLAGNYPLRTVFWGFGLGGAPYAFWPCMHWSLT